MLLITTLVISFLVCCMLEVRCGLARVVSALQAKARRQSYIVIIIIIIIIIISFIQGIYTYIPETNCVPRE